MARKLTIKQQIKALKIILESERGSPLVTRNYVTEKLGRILEGSFIPHQLVDRAVRLKSLDSSRD